MPNKPTGPLCETCGTNYATAITFGKDRRPVYRCGRCWVDYYLAKRGDVVFRFAGHPVKEVLNIWLTNENGTVERMKAATQ